ERDEFRPMSAEEAEKWTLTGQVEIFGTPFDEPPEAEAEAEPSATIYVRVPTVLKQRVDQAAAGAKLSVNAWAMKCMERCITQWPITEQNKGRPSPSTHQPNIFDARRAKTPSDGGAGAFGGSGPTAERS